MVSYPLPARNIISYRHKKIKILIVNIGNLKKKVDKPRGGGRVHNFASSKMLPLFMLVGVFDMLHSQILAT